MKLCIEVLGVNVGGVIKQTTVKELSWEFTPGEIVTAGMVNLIALEATKLIAATLDKRGLISMVNNPRTAGAKILFKYSEEEKTEVDSKIAPLMVPGGQI